MNIDKIRSKYECHVLYGKVALQKATEYLHEHCEKWNEEHERKWGHYIHIAEKSLIAAAVLREVLEEELDG